MRKDRHENRNWKFERVEPCPQTKQPVRFYRSTSNPNLVKQVANRFASTAYNSWESVSYTLDNLRDRFGNLCWVMRLDEVPGIQAHIDHMEAIYRRNETVGAGSKNNS